MIIRIPALKEGENFLSETYDPEDLRLDEEEFTKPVAVTANIDNSETMLSVRLKVETEVNYICDRCAIDFVRPVSREFRLQVLRRQARDEEEEDTEGLVFVDPRETMVDLSDEIVEELVLSRPFKVLCKEDCKGLCYKCGTDLNESSCDCDR